MRKYKIRFIVFALVALFAFLLPIISVQAAQSAPQASIKEKTLYLGGKSFTIKVKNQMKNAKILYQSSDEIIATVSQKGVVKPLAKGTVTINITIQQENRSYFSEVKIIIKEKSSKKVAPIAQWKDGKKDFVYLGTYPQTRVDETQELKDADYDNNDDTILDGVKYKRVSRDSASIFATADDGYHFYWDESIPYLYFRYEPIQWRVLSNEDNEVFLLSEYCLDYRSYEIKGGKRTGITWANSSIRKWLNDKFLKTAFSKEEQKAIDTSTVTNYSDAKLIIQQQETTLDKVFLLSLDELVNDKYHLMKITEWTKKGIPYVTAENGYTAATNYAYSLGVEQREVDENGTLSASYILRSLDTRLGQYTKYQQIKSVWHSGWFLESPYASTGIRPAIKISTDSIQ